MTVDTVVSTVPPVVQLPYTDREGPDMDPNATLARIRKLIDSSDPDDLAELAESIRSLDGWISNGGFLPTAWDAGAHARRRALTRLS